MPRPVAALLALLALAACSPEPLASTGNTPPSPYQSSSSQSAYQSAPYQPPPARPPAPPPAALAPQAANAPDAATSVDAALIQRYHAGDTAAAGSAR